MLMKKGIEKDNDELYEQTTNNNNPALLFCWCYLRIYYGCLLYLQHYGICNCFGRFLRISYHHWLERWN
jgi:hypothetical protein